MNYIFEYLKLNLSWIKDFGTLIFTGTATILAILTYRRARATVLQPKRTEIIKIQTHTLIEFLKSFSNNGNNIDSSLDYITVFRFNFYLALWNADILDLENDSQAYQEMNELIGGWYISTDNNPSGLAQIRGNLDDYFALFEPNDKGRKKPIVVLTKKSMEFINNIRNIANDPFMPREIIQMIDKIIENLYQNLFELIPSEMEKLDFTSLANEEAILVTPYFESFEKSRNHHIEDYKKLQEKIRNYLNVDEKW